MMTRIGKAAQYWILILLASCAPATFEEMRREGEMQTRKLAEELRGIETKEDFQRALPRLRKRFNRIADLLIELKRTPGSEQNPSKASEELFRELARLYEMPGGREWIELAQSEAVQKLR